MSIFVRVQYLDYFGELIRIELIYTLSLIPRSTLACDEYIFVDAEAQNGCLLTGVKPND